MRELTFGIFIIFSLFISANSTKPNSTVARAEYQEPNIRVEHLKKYCNVKNWKKKMPDWLMFRTGPGLRRSDRHGPCLKLSLGFSRFSFKNHRKDYVSRFGISKGKVPFYVCLG